MIGSLAGAIGNGATALILGRGRSVPSRIHSGEGMVRAGKAVNSIVEENAFVGLIGHPRLRAQDSEITEQNSGNLENWRTALFGSSADLDAMLTGHFALFFCELNSRRVSLCTDRFSSYPIYYRLLGDGIAFAQRADVLLGDGPVISTQAIYDYLYFHCLPAPGTIHSDIRQLEPGNVLRWENGRVEIESYWRPDISGPRYDDFDEAKADFHRHLRTSISAEQPDESTGAFLSGGTDSSTVVGLLAERSEAPVKSFSMGFDVPGYDEAGYAKLASRHFGTDHREYYVTPDDLLARIPTVAANLDQPFGNSSLLPSLICVERARDDGITRLLAGDGGDELFGGNTRYAKQKVFSWYEGVPIAIRRGLIEPVTSLDISARVPLLRKVKSYVEQATIPMPARMESYNLFEREGTGANIWGDWMSGADIMHPNYLQCEAWAGLAADNLIDQMLQFDWKFTLADNDLRKVRYAAAMAGIDVGFPLLSDEMTGFSLRLPPEWKVRGLKTRWFFKAALKSFLPNEILRKKKHGFGLPFGTWVCEHEPLQEIAVSALNGLADRGIVDRAYIRGLLGERLPKYPYYYGEWVWVLMILELWFQARDPDWKSDFI